MKKLKTRGFAAASFFSVLIILGSAAFGQDATLKIGGRLMVDNTFANINSPDVSVRGSEVRRARLFASGTYGSAVEYKFEFNRETDGTIELTDGLIKFKPETLPFAVTVGHLKTHNSLEEESSSRFISTIERGAFTDAFSLNRRLGVSVGRTGDNYTINAGLYGESINGAEFERNGNAAAVRSTYLPYETESTLTHLGVSWRYRNNSDSFDETANDGMRYRQRPYAHTLGSDNTNGVLSSGRIITSPRFAVSDNLFALEALAIHNGLWVAGEYALVQATGAAGQEDANFSGGYVEAGFVIGGKRGYKKSGGSFDRTKVYNPVGEGGWGALSLVARYDLLNLNDGPSDGELDTFIIGADWWPTKQTRLRLNYFNSQATNGAAESASGFMARLGFDF